MPLPEGADEVALVERTESDAERERERIERGARATSRTKFVRSPRRSRRPMVGVDDEPQASEACRQLRAT